jgi:hypothetical protein
VTIGGLSESLHYLCTHVIATTSIVSSGGRKRSPGFTRGGGQRGLAVVRTGVLMVVDGVAVGGGSHHGCLRGKDQMEVDDYFCATTTHVMSWARGGAGCTGWAKSP